MLNPTFFQVDTQDGEMRLQTARLDRGGFPNTRRHRADRGGMGKCHRQQQHKSPLAAFLENVRQVFVRRPPARSGGRYRSYPPPQADILLPSKVDRTGATP